MAAENMEQDSIILSKRKATKDHDDVSHDEDDEDLKYLAVGILLGVKIALFCCIWDAKAHNGGMDACLLRFEVTK